MWESPTSRSCSGLADGPSSKGIGLVWTGSPKVHAAWDRALQGFDAELEAVASLHPTGLVIEWGFLGDNLHVVRGLINRGYEMWFLDGDRCAAFASWQAAHPSEDPAAFFVQVGGLAEIDQGITDIFGHRRLWVLDADGSRKPDEEILSTVSELAALPARRPRPESRLGSRVSLQ